MMAFPFRRVAIVGLGLMGGSVAKALRAAGYTGDIAACLHGGDKALQTLRAEAESWQIKLTVVLSEALKDADLVVLATPPAVLLMQLSEIAQRVSDTAIVSDVASTKSAIAERGAELLGARFVAAHPVIGSEKTGFAAAREDLYRGAQVVLTPQAGVTSVEALQKIRAFWRFLGADVLEMSPPAHDTALAATSHLPHLLAFTYMAGLEADASRLKNLAGGGLRDFSRIADSDPRLWTEILRENRHALCQQLQALQQHLAAAEVILQKDDTQALAGLLTKGRNIRRQFHFPLAHS
ncbi:MAG: prephenate dehydrogenase [Acidithiobacillus sp.]